MRDGQWLIGWGMATATYPMNYTPASAMARLLPDGTAEVTSASSDTGPGTWTSMTQVAAETLGLPIERVKFALGDTRLPRAPVHGGSMTMASFGSAVQAACRRVREDALARGGANDLGQAMRRIGRPVEASADTKRGEEAQRFSMHAFGAVLVEVAVDPDLGETRVRRIVGAYGAGRIFNPKTTRSQCIGGMIGGIGMALMEHSVVDGRTGRVVNLTMAGAIVMYDRVRSLGRFPPRPAARAATPPCVLPGIRSAARPVDRPPPHLRRRGFPPGRAEGAPLTYGG
jgi:xanthine dehydrogenase YagR molybdenum-binding subunit